MKRRKELRYEKTYKIHLYNDCWNDNYVVDSSCFG